MPATALVTDSSSQLSDEVRSRAGATVVPMTITVDGVDHLEGVDLSVEDFYARLSDGAEVSTAAPSPGELLAAYEALAGQGAEAIVSIHLAASLSATVGSAQVAARLSPVPVTVVDSGTAAFGVGCCVLAAAEALAAGATAADAAAHAQRVGAVVGNVFIVGVPALADRAGRVGAGLTGGDQGVVPVLALEQGIVRPVAEATGLVEALDAIVAFVAERAAGAPQRLAVGDAVAPSLGAALVTRLAALGLGSEVLRYTLGPSVGAHTGAGTVGAVFHPLLEHR